ncbi:MAG: hydroxymethylbilane synthase [Candidatus Omnitrophota bacterium]|nr:hydroxymethylbilane synthase [Candidatus Omnitrophota bacterium]
MRSLVIGTRGSSLAMCQAQLVQTRLEERFPGRPIRLAAITAQADKDPELPLTMMSGEGVFVKELETALLESRVDLAVHSMKDLPLDVPRGLRLAAVLEREEPRDALVSRSGQPFDQLPSGSRIGTSSPRRQSQLLYRRKDLQILEIRGNVDTRMRKLDEGRYDAIVVAACGLIRLGLEERVTEYLDLTTMLPEPGQGALAVEVRADDLDLQEMMGGFDDPTSRACVEAERAFLRALGGGCRVPIAAYAQGSSGMLQLEGAVLSPDGSRRLRDRATGSLESPTALGEVLAQRLSAQGAEELLSTERKSTRP